MGGGGSRTRVTVRANCAGSSARSFRGPSSAKIATKGSAVDVVVEEEVVSSSIAEGGAERAPRT